MVKISELPAGSTAAAGDAPQVQGGATVRNPLGTMAYQSAAAVAITGGTIDGTVIGGSTPAAAIVTTLDATTDATVPLVQGGDGSGDDLRLTSTSNATKGTVNIGNATTGLFFDETNERLALGANDTTIDIAGASSGVDFAIHNDEGGEVCQVVFRYATAAARSACWFGARARGNIGAENIVQDDDRLVTIQALGFDGVDYAVGAQILAEVDGTPGSNDMPTRWVFLTTPDGSGTPVEAVRIDSAQIVTFANTPLIGVNAVLDAADIGVSVQAWDANLDQIAALAVTDDNFIVGNGSAWVAESGATARASLGALGGSVGIVDGGVPRADGTGGVTLQSSGITISDADLMTIDLGLTQFASTAWAQATALRLGDNLSEAGSATPGSANQFGLLINTFTPVTSSAAGYEKCAALFIAASEDPSEYGPDILRDSVGLDMRGYILPANALGRVWGGYSEARIVTGGVGDGILNAHEFQVINEGTEQASVATTTSKYALNVVSNGSVPATAVMYVNVGTDGFRNGIVFASDALTNATDPLINITDGEFNVTRDGDLTAAGGMRVGFTGTPTDDRLEVGDATFYLDNPSAVPAIIFDTNDSIRYDRTNNQWIFATGGNDGPVIRQNIIFPSANDNIALGAAGVAFSDLFLAEGGVINWDSGDVTITQSGNSLTVAGGNLIFPGTGTNDSAAAGIVGEIIESTVLVGSVVALTTATSANVTSISLTAGDWDVWGNVWFNPAATTSITRMQGAINTTSATLPTAPGAGARFAHSQAALVPNAQIGYPVGQLRISLSGTTTVYLVAEATFTVSTLGAYGYIGARRVR